MEARIHRQAAAVAAFCAFFTLEMIRLYFLGIRLSNNGRDNAFVDMHVDNRTGRKICPSCVLFRAFGAKLRIFQTLQTCLPAIERTSLGEPACSHTRLSHFLLKRCRVWYWLQPLYCREKRFEIHVLQSIRWSEDATQWLSEA